jgi:hypothetical protein
LPRGSAARRGLMRAFSASVAAWSRREAAVAAGAIAARARPRPGTMRPGETAEFRHAKANVNGKRKAR